MVKNIVKDGTVLEVLPNYQCRIEIDDMKGHIALCYISGKLRQNHIRILVGDRVTVELSAYDLTRGRITYRYK